MTPFQTKLILVAAKIIEIIFIPVSLIVGLYMSLLTIPPPRFFSYSYKLFTKLNWLPVRFHYHQPIIKKDMLPSDYESREENLTGVDLLEEEQLALLRSFKYSSELENIPFSDSGNNTPFFDNINFGPGDAEILYSMIRFFKPQKVIEIGSGYSTRFAHLALQVNEKETGQKAIHKCIEPFEQPKLSELDVSVIRKRVETIDLDFFKDLKENDILLIDSSHIIRTQGDVVYEYLKLIPSLNRGVIVHCHDIFLPREYPLYFITLLRRFWNEQYLLQALLTNTNRYKPLLSVNFLFHCHRKELEKHCPSMKMKIFRDPSSFWLQINQ
jgi:hypothetical protein